MFTVISRKEVTSSMLMRLVSHTSDRQSRELLAQNLKISLARANVIIDGRKDAFYKIPHHLLVKNCETCVENKVLLFPLRNTVSCLKLRNVVLKNRIFLLQEIGVSTVSIHLINRFVPLMNTPVNIFKRKTDMCLEENIAENMIDSLKLSEKVQSTRLSDSSLVREHYIECFSNHVLHKLDISYKEFFNGKNSYRSLRLFTELLNFFMEDIGLHPECIKKCLHHPGVCLNNVKSIINIFESKGLDWRSIIKRKPTIFTYDANNVKEVLKTLEMYNIKGMVIENHLSVLRLTMSDVISRMEIFKEHDYLKIWIQNPRILHLIDHFKLVMDRVMLLSDADKIKWANMHTVTCSNTFFTRYMQDEVYTTFKRNCVSYIVYKELGDDKLDAVEFLFRHAYWSKIPFIKIEETLRYLKEYFSIDDICNNIQIALYPRSVITKTLETLYVEHSSPKGKDNNFSSTQYLALCLYTIEKENHFSGDGVWNPEYHSQEIDIKLTDPVDFTYFQTQKEIVTPSQDNIFFQIDHDYPVEKYEI